jgi:hypothetical protein
MSKKLVTSYTFSASAKTIVSSDFTSLEKIQLITNVTDNIIIYNFAASAKGGSLSGTTLTLTYDTTTMDDTDKLQIFVDEASLIPGTGATNLGKAEDAAHTSGDTGVMALAVRSDSEAALAGSSGDYIPLITDSTGKLRTSAAGTVAHDAVDAGAPVKIGGKASSSAPSDVSATGDRVDAYFDMKGRLKVDASDVAIPITDNSGSLTVDGTVAATQSGTWTVQPGNTANTTAWKVDGSAVTQPVSASSLPLPTGAATAANQATEIASLANIPTKGLALPAQTDYFTPISQVPQKTWRNGFDRVFAAGFDTAWMTTLVTGAGMTVAQSGGSAVITTGTTANSETIGRSLLTFDGSLTLRYSTTLSQRIANQQFFVEMVDVIGDGLTLLVNSATSITVTIPANPFTSANVGQSMYVGNITGVASAIPGRYAIASVSGNNVTFTVASWPGSGSGTVSLFGWNYHHVIYDATTATSCTFDSQRNGWNSGETTATINTTASPGHVGVYGVTDGKTVFSDQLSASSTTLELTQRGSRVRNVPVDGTALYVQIRALNGSSAPATTTTWTIGFTEVDNFVLSQMSLNNIVPQSANSALPMQVLNTPNIGTVTTLTGTTALTPGVAAANLGKAEDAVAASGDTGVFALGVRRDGAITTSPTSAAADYSELAVDNYGQIRTAVQGRTTNPTAAADGNGVIVLADKLGKQVVVGSIRDLKVNQLTTITASTSETTVLTAVASTFLDVYGVILVNSSATASNVSFKDSTAGTTRFNIYVPAGETRGFMLNESAAFAQTTVNNNWTATSSASVTSLVITMLAVKNT